LDVADLGTHAVATAVELAVDDDAATDTGADGDADDEPLLAAGAEARLTPGGGVRVVLHDAGQPQPPLDLLPERAVAPAQQVRCEVDAGPGRVDEAGDADADRLDLAFPPKRLDDRGDRRRGRLGV